MSAFSLAFHADSGDFGSYRRAEKNEGSADAGASLDTRPSHACADGSGYKVFTNRARHQRAARYRWQMWFYVEPSEIDYLERSPYQIHVNVLLDAPADRVFELVAERMTEWFRDVKSVHWQNAQRGVGARREVILKTISVKERFLIWEPAKRLAFSVDAATVPILAQMVEDVRLESIGEQTRLRWTIHYTPKGLFKIAHRFVRPVYESMFERAAQRLVAYVAKST